MSCTEGGLACPTWVGGPPGPSLGHHTKVSLPEPLPRTTTVADPQQRIATSLPLSVTLPTVAKCPELPQACVVGRSGGGLWVGQGCDLCRVTVRPPLSGSPPRRLYFLGAIHRYEGPNLHHLPRGRKGRCGPGSGKRSWGLRWKHSLPALSAEAPRCNALSPIISPHSAPQSCLPSYFSGLYRNQCSSWFLQSRE